MTSRYHCEGCGWQGEHPVPVADVLGDSLWTAYLCPECWAEAVRREGPAPPRAMT